MRTNTESHNWTVCRERNLGILNSKWAVSSNPPHSGIRKVYRRGERKTVRASEDGGHQGNSVFLIQQDCAHMNSETITDPSQTDSTERGSGHGPPFLMQNVSPTDYCLLRKTNFFQWSLTGYTNHT